MSTHETRARLVDSGVIAVMRGADADTVIDVAEALRAGGVTAIELTADTPGVMDMIADVASTFADGETVVGAGTVTDSETARAAMLAGAEFVVCPSLHEDVIDACNRYDTAVFPGVMTPTEAITAYEAGATAVKLFPASTVGPGHLSAIKGPFGHVDIIPTGGVDLDNVADFIDAGAMAVGAGSALVDDDAVAAGDYDEITAQARRFTETIEAAREG